MKFPGDPIDETDEEVIPGYLYSDEQEEYFYTAEDGVITGTFDSLDSFTESQRLLNELSTSSHFQQWVQSFAE